MKNQLLHTIFVILTFLPSILMAQWESLGNNIIPTNHRVWSIKVAPDQSVWAIATYDNFPPTGQAPKVYRSADEGLSWTGSEITAALSKPGLDVSPVDSNAAFIALRTAGMYKTVDGGANWSKVDSYNLDRSLAVHFFNSNDGWARGTDNDHLVMSVTSDGGNTWTHMGGEGWTQPPGTSLPAMDADENLPAVTFTANSAYDYNDQTIIIGTTKGNYWISTDKGYNWTRKSTPLADRGLNASNIALKDESTFMVAGDIEQGTVNGVPAVNFTTQDGGDTWIEGYSGLTAAASHYIPNSDSVFIMTGHNDFGWGGEGTAISYDYGENWEIIDNTSIIAIDFIDEHTGYGTCCNNIWATANGQIHKWNFSLPTSTNEIPSSKLVKLMPNPVSTHLIVEISDAFQFDELLLELITTDGQVMPVHPAVNAHRISISTSDLPKGCYFLRVTGNEKSVVKKFIKS